MVEYRLFKAVKTNSCWKCKVSTPSTCKCALLGSREESEGSDFTGSQQGIQQIGMQKTSIPIYFTLWGKEPFVNFNKLLELITLEYDSVRGALVIRCKPGITSGKKDILYKFLIALRNEYNLFRKLLTKQGATTANFIGDLKGNILTIYVPNTSYFKKFFNRLGMKNVISSNSLEQPEQATTHLFRPTPFSEN